MATIFAAARLSPASWKRGPFAARIAAIKAHYQVEGVVQSWSRFDETTGIGVFVAWRDYDGQPFQHFVDGVLLTHLPFGASKIGSGPHPHQAVTAALKADQDAALRTLHPPQAVLAVGDDRVDLWNDALGLAKVFRLDVDGGAVIGNRAMAMHMLGLREPKTSNLGWAAEQTFGWFLDDLTPFDGLSRLPGGSHVALTPGGVKASQSDVVYEWFTEPPQATLDEGMARLRREVKIYTATEQLEIALSGGRDSRASAAVFADAPGFTVRFRTNRPPELEASLARDLMQRHPRFSHFKDDDSLAYASDGAVLWRATSPVLSRTDLNTRGERWARSQEGFASSASLYSDCPYESPFPDWKANIYSVAGVAGEAAKAYYWSPRMASGAFARNLPAFMDDIRTPIAERLKTHPLTKGGGQGFAADGHLPALVERMRARRQAGTEHGVHGYRFLDLWWLADRFGAGAATGYHLTNTIAPFLAPEYLATALQDTVQRRARATLLSDMVNTYMPSWSEVPYFDAVQHTVPPEQLRYYRPNTILWDEPNRDAFLSILETTDEFEPGVREQALARFTGEIGPQDAATLNARAFGLVHRHFVGRLCAAVGAVVRKLRCVP